MNTVLFVNATIVFSDKLFLVITIPCHINRKILETCSSIDFRDLFSCLSVCQSICPAVCMLVFWVSNSSLLHFFVTVQDVLYTGLDVLTSKVHSLEDKYVKFLYKKVQTMEKCNPRRSQTQLGKNV